MSDWSRFDVSAEEIRKKIEDLHVVRSQRRKWIAGTSFCVLAITTVCLLITRQAALSLLQDGPTHDEFVANLTRQVTRQILPQLDGSGIQASCRILPSADPYLPIPHNRTSPSVSEMGEVHGSPTRTRQSTSTTVGEKTNAGGCGAVDDPQKPLGHFREQSVSEYQATVTRIVNDLTAIRGREGSDTHAGLSAGAVASLFVSRVQEGLPKPSREDYNPPVELQTSRDAR